MGDHLDGAIVSVGAVLIDTAGPCIGVAARSASGHVFDQSQRIVAGADGWLTPALARALAHVGAGPFSLAVVTGPGAFTGVRVGVAHALGLGLARHIDIVPLSSLAVRACGAPGFANLLVLLDGKKGRVYAQRFDTRSVVPKPLDNAVDIDPNLVGAGDGAAVGEGAIVYADVLRSRGYHPVPQADRLDLPAAFALLASVAAVPTSAVRPMYLREPDAVPPLGIVV